MSRRQLEVANINAVNTEAGAGSDADSIPFAGGGALREGGPGAPLPAAHDAATFRVAGDVPPARDALVRVGGQPPVGEHTRLAL